MVTTQYPTTLPTTTQCPTGLQDNVSDVLADQQNAPHAEILAICKELGVLPKGSSSDVKTRLNTLSLKITDRGDPAANDFLTGAFTTDGTVKDLDLSSIIGTGEKLIFPRLIIRDNVIDSSIAFRKKGNTNFINLFGGRILTVNIFHYIQGILFCDSDGKVQYVASNVVWTDILFSVLGWVAI